MKIKSLQVNNYRLLKNFQLDLEDELSLVIGKNNTGKTSLLSLLDKFLNFSEKNKFSLDDFNLEFKELLLLKITDDTIEEFSESIGIKLRILIEYFEDDDISNISKIMMDLDPENNNVVIGFDFCIDYENLTKLRKDFNLFEIEEKKKEKATKDYKIKNIDYFLRNNLKEYFNYRKKSIQFDVTQNKIIEGKYIDLDKEKISIKEIINFKYISAKREVSNKSIDKTLSLQTSEIYKKSETNETEEKAIDEFKEKLRDTDEVLSTIYSTIFENVVNKVKSFGGIKKDDSIIEIKSTLQHRELLEGNTTVMYNHNNHSLPESYNGLGYMNLISMIFQIEILVQEFKKDKNEKPSDINLLYIEEPEAHTHPQMQYVFIKNIKQLLKEGIKREDGENRRLQYIISTHSSHILSESNFDDVKYLKKVGENCIEAKNLKELKAQYEVNSKEYQFLKQYLTISRAEIFFADKCILIEGDTERILFSTILKKIDIEEDKKHKLGGTKDKFLPLLSQNISIIEVGAYSHIFEKFIDFIGIKTLIITDLDTVDDNGEACEVSVGKSYTNTAINFFYSSASLEDLKKKKHSEKILNKKNGNWEVNDTGNLCVCYQIEEDDYHARSFEDAFININRTFIVSLKDNFKGIKHKQYFDILDNNPYYLAMNCIKKKTHFALDIIYNSNEDFSNWAIPTYIKESLLWLKQD
ncbi:ATP-dependent nuclease [Riemerella anatipestifer]|uniref:ATP-dependent endonuclease n=1 Tax=Riemerella anatipestifer TaxID=34085 RepID=A0AAP6HDM2_RIEAN|nr:ATP-dependent endonuclease [Riemerella anatipestifer]MBT0548918.1 ATP-dependent endonuclease [Riemerella anatipestifer]MBT0555232.1 ATP-dependent endonuclease [Riemerella anatipestifer]MBT0559681.1 ATP-dependent endonuclease [Riemerella anatipestifer]MCO7354742.1 ATP-dependent endonuclease [Riemerella anatipestifer]MCU7539769.1 ATP-dependent endonuclease [Riemerella anatipestifer]